MRTSTRAKCYSRKAEIEVYTGALPRHRSDQRKHVANVPWDSPSRVQLSHG